MNYLNDIDKNFIEYKSLIDSLKKGKRKLYLHGLIEESTGHFLYSLYGNTGGPVFVIVENESRALDVYDSIKYFLPQDSYIYPADDINFEDFQDVNQTGKAKRLEVLKLLKDGKAPLVVTSLEAMNRRIISPNLWEELELRIDMDSDIDLHLLGQRLLALGYERVQTIDSKGQFAIRGGIVDIYSLDASQPYRIELFDSEVDSIRTFNILDQRSMDNRDRITISPADDILIKKDGLGKVLESLVEDYDRQKKTIGKILDEDSRILALENLENKFLPIIDKLKNGQGLNNQDLLAPYLDSSTFGYLFDYMDKNSILVYDDIVRIDERAKLEERDYQELLSYEMENYRLLRGHKDIYLSYKEISQALDGFIEINVTGLLKRIRLLKIEEVIEIKTIEAENYNNSWQVFLDSLENYKEEGYKIIISSHDLDKAENLQKRLLEDDMVAAITEDLDYDLSPGQIVILPHSIKNGFEYPKSKVILISHKEIYGDEKIKSKSKKIMNKRDLINYTDLSPGDYIVHENYGLGKYIGIKNIEVQDSQKDYLEILYRDRDKLYIPTDEMDLISKYIGGKEREPRLSKLNSLEWSNTKAKAQKDIDEIAENLVELYAKRSKIKGFAYSEDSPWQKEFEDSFIYEETQAQLRSIREIKEDMESDRPMDRLLCGDVGYGKTEVAIRAAFKAIMDGKQVALLAPTTILVQQHYETIRERFRNFPIKIDYLSRFKSPAKADLTKEAIKKARVDLVVGTHSLLSKSVRFKDLGLLIVDEEQRFGVKDKEKIKEIKANIDVLTLSATPIPRTLQMSLSGIREMSLLDEAPENRMPTNTYVVEYKDSTIRQAIIRELRRGGQVYFVYNRVRGIDLMRQEIEDLVPEARVTVAHGQMSTKKLENTLEAFINKEYDILLSTSIIETGMDIQNVNTMIIYNADMMGLSQLYQLKGRIGRGNKSSYAYFTYQENKVITEVSEKRLKAIKDFNELGSGYKIAMRDLELRGAGNLLGESQHGHIESIGYDLYVRMLEKTVNKLKGIEEVEEKDVKIDVNLAAYIPDSYIADQNEKINMYKKISMIQDEKDHYTIIDELIDRFGDLPKPVENVVDIALIKALMMENSMTELIEVEKYMEFRYTQLVDFNMDKLEKLSEDYSGFLRFDLSKEPKIIIELKEDKLDEPLKILRLISKINLEERNEKR